MKRVLLPLLPVLFAALLPVAAAQPTAVHQVVDATAPSAGLGDPDRLQRLQERVRTCSGPVGARRRRRFR